MFTLRWALGYRIFIFFFIFHNFSTLSILHLFIVESYTKVCSGITIAYLQQLKPIRNLLNIRRIRQTWLLVINYILRTCKVSAILLLRIHRGSIKNMFLSNFKKISKIYAQHILSYVHVISSHNLIRATNLFFMTFLFTSPGGYPRVFIET